MTLASQQAALARPLVRDAAVIVPFLAAVGIAVVPALLAANGVIAVPLGGT